jgi:hypothetical protein
VANRVSHPTERIQRNDGRDGGPRKVPGAVPAPIDADIPMIKIPETVQDVRIRNGPPLIWRADR